MTESYLFAAIVLAILAAIVGVVLLPRFERQEKIIKRMGMAHAATSDGSDSWFGRYANRLITVRIMSSDYAEIKEVLERTGMAAERIPVVYIAACWLAPLGLLMLAGALMSWWLGLVVAILAFLLSRRLVRRKADQVDARMNREAVELCYLMRMFMESGISLERAMRLISAQATPLIPVLIRHINRFNRLLDAGESRRFALQELGANKNVPVLHDLSLLLSQSSRLGTTISGSLDKIIRQAQAVERARVQEATNKISAKMSMVMVLCMLPALMVLIGGPALSAFSKIFQ